MFTKEIIKKNGNRKFYIFSHTLNEIDLDNYIIEMLYDKDSLNYLFEPASQSISKEDRIRQLRRFIPSEFKNNEKQVLQDYDNNKSLIESQIIANKSYYSFYAEALMAKLNIDHFDQNLISGVININDTLVDQHTGADACMFSENSLVLGEAKFYMNFREGLNKIISDFQHSSFKNKLDNFYNSTINSNSLTIKGIASNDITKYTLEDFRNLKITLSGFVLHDSCSETIKSGCYNLIEEDIIVKLLPNCMINFYHLPIKSKQEFIIKVIEKALELIVYG